MIAEAYKSLSSIIRKNWFVMLLVLITILTRLPILHYESIPFTFDHGKDSLAVMDLVLNRNVKLIGPWTSIPGLFFGPAWYYLLAPSFIIFTGEPVGFVWTMLFLVVLEIILLHRFFGKTAALVLFTIFHYNLWYLIGLFPLYIISFAQLLEYIAHGLEGKMKIAMYVLFVLYLVTPITKTYLFITKDYMVQQNSSTFLPVKKRTLASIRSEAGTRPFASYQFAAHIYDFDWQYLYFLDGLKQRTLPTQFAYQEEYGKYAVEKDDLESYFSHDGNQKPELVFHIMEITPGSEEMRKGWINSQVKVPIYKTWQESDSIIVLAGKHTSK